MTWSRHASDGTVAARCIAESLIGCTLTGLSPGVRYQVSVQAANLAGTGPVTTPVDAAPIAESGPPPGTRFLSKRIIAAEVEEIHTVRAADIDGGP